MGRLSKSVSITRILPIIVVFLILCSVPGIGETANNDSSEVHYTFAVKCYGKYALTDEEGNILTVPMFERVGRFSEGLAPVQKDKKWGYINRKGETVIDFKYDGATEFSGKGTAFVYLNEKGKDGENVIRRIEIDRHGNPVGAKEQNRKTEEHSPEMEEVEIPELPSMIPTDKKVKNFAIVESYAIVSTKNPTKPIAFSNPQNGFSEGLLPVSFNEKESGYLKTDGTIAFKGGFQKLYPFVASIAVVQRDTKYFVVDPTGKQISGPFDDCPWGKYTEERLIVGRYSEQEKRNLYGVIDRDGKLLVPCKYRHIMFYVNGFAPMHSKAGQRNWEYLNRDGNIASEKELEHIFLKKELRNNFYSVGVFSDGLAEFQYEENGKHGFVNRDGEVIIDAKFDCVFPFAKHPLQKAFENGICLVEINGKAGAIDVNGREVISCIYSELGTDKPDQLFESHRFRGEYCTALKTSDGHNLWGFVDRQGKEVIPFKYCRTMEYDGRIALLRRWAKREEEIDTQGPMQKPVDFEEIIRFSDGKQLLPYKCTDILWSFEWSQGF